MCLLEVDALRFPDLEVLVFFVCRFLLSSEDDEDEDDDELESEDESEELEEDEESEDEDEELLLLESSIFPSARDLVN